VGAHHPADHPGAAIEAVDRLVVAALRAQDQAPVVGDVDGDVAVAEPIDQHAERTVEHLVRRATGDEEPADGLHAGDLARPAALGQDGGAQPPAGLLQRDDQAPGAEGDQHADPGQGHPAQGKVRTRADAGHLR
jgi:hypothetical protein